jgi:deoxyribodipyrimidine photo-lyase
LTTLLWFNRDLRLADNPALAAALARGAPLVPVYILDDAEAGPWAPGGASRWWLHGSLQALDAALRARGSRLILRRGRALDVLEDLLGRTGAVAVYWNRRYEPWARTRGETIKRTLQQRGIEVRSFNAGLLHEPSQMATLKGDPYRVFTPFWKALQAQVDPGTAAPAPPRLGAPAAWPPGDALDDWGLLPRAPDWAGGMRAAWTPGEAGAQARLAAFTAAAVFDYGDRRNFPGSAATSRLSPHLHFGEIGPRQIWRAVTARSPGASSAPPDPGVRTFLSEVGWREFSYHLLFHFPQLPETPLRAAFSAFAWEHDDAALAAWRAGRTGYPIVDAGMRELWHTGWMHNRVRMIVASFLVKDLLLPWRRGEDWFWDTLVDADLASNAASWQWVAGCGADAAPYFRVFNPSLQGAKFDAQGSYVRRWVPELARLPDALLHAPWAARPADLAAAGIALGRDYPAPVIDHAFARQRALHAFAELKELKE